MVTDYIDRLARTDGELSWCEVGWDFYEDERPDGSLKPIDIETGERLE
jgi:hypothetical protein